MTRIDDDKRYRLDLGPRRDGRGLKVDGVTWRRSVRGWALSVAKRAGPKKARVALARKPAVVLHCMEPTSRLRL
jgi:hypothetical protein